MKDVIDAAILLIGKVLEVNGVHVNMNFGTDSSIYSYKSELTQVFLNLFKNVLDIVKEKSLIDVTINIEVKREDGFVVTYFEDNAGGIPSDVLDKIFLPYFSTKNELQGTGLGLHLSKTIVEDHCSGKVEVENRENGACFIISLPLQ